MAEQEQVRQTRHSKEQYQHRSCHSRLLFILGEALVQRELHEPNVEPEFLSEQLHQSKHLPSCRRHCNSNEPIRDVKLLLIRVSEQQFSWNIAVPSSTSVEQFLRELPSTHCEVHHQLNNCSLRSDDCGDRQRERLK